MRSELVVDAIQMAIWRRRPPTGQCVAHSDHGSQSDEDSFSRDLLGVLNRLVPSLGRHVLHDPPVLMVGRLHTSSLPALAKEDQRVRSRCRRAKRRSG